MFHTAKQQKYRPQSRQYSAGLLQPRLPSDSALHECTRAPQVPGELWCLTPEVDPGAQHASHTEGASLLPAEICSWLGACLCLLGSRLRPQLRQVA